MYSQNHLKKNVLPYVQKVLSNFVLRVYHENWTILHWPYSNYYITAVPDGTYPPKGWWVILAIPGAESCLVEDNTPPCTRTIKLYSATMEETT